MEALKNSRFSYEQQMVFTMLMLDPSDKTIPVIQTPEWIIALGHDLKTLFKQKKISKMFFNDKGVICVE